MDRVMSPGAPIPASGVAIVSEKVMVLIDQTMIPVCPPTPATPIKAPEKASNINARAESKAKAVIGVTPIGIITVKGRSPDIRRVVVRDVDYFGVGWLDLNHRSVPLLLGVDSLL